MARPDVERALLVAKYQAVKGMSADTVRDVYPGDSPTPFDAVCVKISSGELTTGSKLMDFIVMEYGLDDLDQLATYYWKLFEGVDSHTGELVATVDWSHDWNRYGGKDPKRDRGYMELGVLTGYGMDVNFQAGQEVDDKGTVVRVFPSIELETDLIGATVFLPLRPFRKPHVSAYDHYHVRFDKVESFTVDHETTKSPKAELGGKTLLVGDITVNEFFGKGRGQRTVDVIRKALNVPMS